VDLVLNGPRHELRVRDGVAWCRLWWLTDDDAPAIVGELLPTLRTYVIGGAHPARDLVLDLREAPPFAVAAARAAMIAVLELVATAGTPCVALIGPTSIQRDQIEQLCRRHAPQCAHPTADVARLRAWLSRWQATAA
jgi:hypothetical protein